MSDAGESLPKLNAEVRDTEGDILDGLFALAPGVFTEDGKVDWERLRLELGEAASTERERYSLSWAGKREAVMAVRDPGRGTLVPMPEESVDWDSTENLIIEGDNLEVLKLLQKSYHSRVKMIYIDPPYNTGDDHTYDDDFREPLQAYLEYTGQAERRVNAGQENENRSGRVHSSWLSKMYPRLFLARNLLREDGVIFVSIDDQEAANLRLLMNEVFGEENFLGCVCWQKKYSPANDTVDFSASHDFVLVFARGRVFEGKGKYAATLSRTARTEEQNKRYKNPDNDPRGPWRDDNYVCNKPAEKRPNLYYPITQPVTGEIVWPKRSAVWRFSKTRHASNVESNRVWWGADGRSSVPAYKRFLSEVRGIVADTWWTYNDAGHNDEATKQFRALFADCHVDFDTPKPSRLIKRMLQLATDQDDADCIVLDFFAGSGTTGQAVLEQNAADGGNRQFILVQMPEPVDNPATLADRREIKTIAGITRERVRRAGAAMEGADQPTLTEGDGTVDRGFRAFKLAQSHFVPWQDDSNGDPEKLAELLKQHMQGVLDETDPQGVLWEILLKSGYPLSADVEVRNVGGQDVYAVDGGTLLVNLSMKLTDASLRAMIDAGPEKIVTLDDGFAQNDSLKANIAQQVKQHNSLHPDSPIDFRTV